MKNIVSLLILALTGVFFFTASYAQEPDAAKAAEINASNIHLSGQIIDKKTRAPLPGATIHLQNTTHEVLTDDHGKFKFLTGQKLPVVFIVSYVGYQTREITINQRENIVVELNESNTQLSDVVVVGYGTQSRKHLISSVTKVHAGEVKSIPVAGVDAQLQGKASGVQINSNTGVPGDGVFIRVRGATSINASNDPLYVVDGVFGPGYGMAICITAVRPPTRLISYAWQKFTWFAPRRVHSRINWQRPQRTWMLYATGLSCPIARFPVKMSCCWL